MKIGDEVYVHGYVDEIRKDVVIIRNKGGYFGTVAEEVRVEQTEPQTYTINPKEPTNMPKCFDCEDFFTCDRQCDKVECEKCKHFREEAEMYTHQCEFYFMECKFEPKDEPQTDEEQFCIEHKCTYYRPKEGGCTKNNGDCPFDEPQTDCAWK